VDPPPDFSHETFDDIRLRRAMEVCHSVTAVTVSLCHCVIVSLYCHLTVSLRRFVTD